MPELPYRLAVITSKTAAGYQDFRNHLLHNPDGYAFQLDLFEALMQGEQAPVSIMEALEEIGQKNYDAALILRGGGSELDLQCFDHFELAVAIATCPVPVITAIGHDKDVHIADMVAHASVKTPTALADLFLEAYQAQDAVIDRLQGRVAAGLQRRVSREELRVKSADAAIRQAIQRRLSALEMLLQRSIGRISRGFLQKYNDVAKERDVVAHRLRFATLARVGEGISALALMESRIKSTDPRTILSMGYVLVTGKDNKVLKTVGRVAVGDRIGVRFQDGSILAKVDEVVDERVDNNKTQIA